MNPDPGEATQPRRRRTLGRLGRAFPSSRLARLILGLNLLTLAILLIGVFGLNEWQRSLVDARIQYLNAQAQLVATVLYEAGATQGEPYPELDPIASAQFLRADLIPDGQRARLFGIDGALVADSYLVSDAVEVTPLPDALPNGVPPPEENAGRQDRRLEAAQNALAAEIEAALTGAPQSGVRPNEVGDRVVSVSVPIRHVQTVIGVLTLEANDFSEIVTDQRQAMIPFALIALVVSLLTSFLLYLWVVRPVLRLANAADRVRMQRARAISLPDLEARRDEIGVLASALESMTATLQDRMTAIERFAADVAHEIKNPLTSIRSALETLSLLKDEDKKQRLIGVVQRDVVRLDRLITDISNASRLDAELSRDAPRAVDLPRLLTDLVSLFNEDGGPKVTLEVDANSSKVVGREGPLGQVFRNLIDNARSFSPQGGEVRLRLAPEAAHANRIEIVVEDEGPGIPEDNLETIFKRFYTSRPQGAAFGANSGLGLSIARQIVQAHNGEIHAENRRDDAGNIIGARFIVRLPAA